MTMPAYKGPLNMAKNDPDCKPSAAYTFAPFQGTDEFPSAMWCANALKQGIPLMYWTTIAVCRVALYSVDVRELPGITPAQAKEHSDALCDLSGAAFGPLKIDTAAQRDVALKLIRCAFKNQDEMLEWLGDQSKNHCGARMLHKAVGVQEMPKVPAHD